MGDQEKIMWNFQGSSFLALEFPRDLMQLCGISGGGALFCPEFPEVKLKNENFQGDFKNVCPQPPYLIFFWNSPFILVMALLLISKF